VTRWEAFTQICAYLRDGLIDTVPQSPVRSVRWERLIEASSYHYVTPALGWCLRDRASVPQNIREYFAAALSLNAQRNEHMLAALARIVAALNAADVEPVLLKGAARLVDGIYPAPGLRLLRDLDVLIPLNEGPNAAARLKDIGFDETGAKGPPHHLPVLWEQETGTVVELHTQLVIPPYDRIIPTAWFWERTEPFKFQNLKVRLPNATASIVHTIVHDQLHHNNFQEGRFELQQLLDLALLRARDERAIDWIEVDRQFCHNGMDRVVATYLEFANELFAQAPPPLTHVPVTDALPRFRGRMSRWGAIKRLVALSANDFLLARREDPLAVFKLFNPSIWLRRIRTVRTQLRLLEW
jgi:hypothetical protein